MHGSRIAPRPFDVDGRLVNGGPVSHLPRRLALLGGTTRWRDCVEALRYLWRPARLVQGVKIKEYEDAFAASVGANHAIGFASGRVSLYGLLRAHWRNRSRGWQDRKSTRLNSSHVEISYAG